MLEALKNMFFKNKVNSLGNRKLEAQLSIVE